MGARFRVVTYGADNTAWRSRMEDLTVDVQTAIGMIAMLMAWLAGLLVHMTKEMARNKIGLVDYWKSYPLHSVISILLSTAGMLVMYSHNSGSLFMYFSLSYILDSFINRVEAQTQTKATQNETSAS